MRLSVCFRKGIVCMFVAMAALLSGCASLTSQEENDPLEFVNRGVYKFNQKADEYVLEPVAKGYQYVTPDIVDQSITNFFSNLDDVVVFVNDILQLKFNQALSDGGRVLVNTTVGVLGFVDMATDMGMPKNNEDFGQTLGAYGVGTGPYVVLPILGSSTLRDTLGIYADTFVDPIQQIDDSDARWATMVLKGVDTRADLIRAKKIADQAALDPYEFERSAHFQRRNYLIYDGNPPMDDEDIFDDE
ncbi:VacJ family lipoprotein [Cycloclasticus pugetii]|jgi:phospholipid-binding lipoprotein MlaA|uniref:MlaA family lipoprotein n=1 Tax=Cycloclasticus pugetii TaxID=34068 RepID=UPI0039E7148A